MKEQTKQATTAPKTHHQVPFPIVILCFQSNLIELQLLFMLILFHFLTFSLSLQKDSQKDNESSNCKYK